MELRILCYVVLFVLDNVSHFDITVIKRKTLTIVKVNRFRGVVVS